jgi:DNA-binding transcriptional LysR family regulator
MDRFKSMESFVTVAKCGSYTQAAKQLGVSRAIMSRRVLDLESRLGVRLINRNTRKLSLTDAGLSYLSSCQNVLSVLESAELSLVENRNVARGNLRILTSQTYGIVLQGPATASFMRRYPDIEVYVMTGSLFDQTAELIGGGFDLALRTTEISDSSLVARKIAPLDWFVVATPGYIAEQGSPKTPAELEHHRCLVTGIAPVHNWVLESKSGTETVKISGIGVSNLTTITHDSVLEGLGLSLLPEYIVAGDLAAGRLVRLLPEYKGKQRWLYAIYPRERQLPLKTSLFIDFLRDRFNDCRWDELAVSSA